MCNVCFVCMQYQHCRKKHKTTFLLLCCILKSFKILKDGVEQIYTFQNKMHQGIHLCLGDSKKYEEKYLCSFI